MTDDAPRRWQLRLLGGSLTYAQEPYTGPIEEALRAASALLADDGASGPVSPGGRGERPPATHVEVWEADADGGYCYRGTLTLDAPQNRNGAEDDD